MQIPHSVNSELPATDFVIFGGTGDFITQFSRLFLALY